MLWFLHMIIWFLNLFRSNSRDRAPLFTSYPKKGCSWLNPVYSWNKQLAHTPFPKKINTPITTLRFIGFVAKISVLNPKLPADGQWPGETKESVTFFIWSPLIDRLKNRTSFLLYYLTYFLFINRKWIQKLFHFTYNVFYFYQLRFPIRIRLMRIGLGTGFSCKLRNTAFVAPFPKQLSLD